jgi:hypothetical protein
MAVVAGLLVLAACSPGESTPTPPESTGPSLVPSASALPSTPALGAPTALDAYRNMWKAYVEASRIPDPAYPDLARYTQGDALKVFVNGLTSMQRDGLVGQGDVKVNPAVKAAKPNTIPPTVDVEDCADTSGSRLVKKDGSAYQDTPGGRKKAAATVARLDDGSWKVITFAIADKAGTC